MDLTARTANISESVKDYMTNREELINKDTDHRTGQKLQLSAVEEKANSILMGWKRNELDAAYKTEADISSESFITAKTKIEKSNVFKIIRKMPKGWYVLLIIEVKDM